MLFCTVISPNQLSASMLLAKSIKKYHPNSKIAVCVVDQKIHPMSKGFQYFDQVIAANDIEEGLFDNIKSKYGGIEGIRAMKAPFLNYLINMNSNENIFIYLDPHTKIYGHFHELLSAFKRHSIIFTPYCLEPPSENNVLNEFHLLKNSNINGGFFGFRQTKESKKLLKWWSDCIKNDQEEAIKGLYPDEKWLILALGIYDIHIFKDPCYHTAIWNVNEMNRKIEMNNGNCKIAGKPLRSFFFADLDGELYKALNKKVKSKSKVQAVRKLFRKYRKELKEYDKSVNLEEKDFR